MNIGNFVEFIKKIISDFEKKVPKISNLIWKYEIRKPKSRNINFAATGYLSVSTQIEEGIRYDDLTKHLYPLEKNPRPIRKIRLRGKIRKEEQEEINVYFNYGVITDYIIEMLEDNKEYKSITNGILKKYKKNIIKIKNGDKNIKEKLDLMFIKFIQNILIKALHGNLNEGLIINYAVLFKNILELKPPEYFLLYNIEGILFNTEKIELDNNVILKKATIDDYFEIDDFAALNRNLVIRTSQIILKIENEFDEIKDLLKYEERIFSILKLFKHGNIVFNNRILLDKNPTKMHLLRQKKGIKRILETNYRIESNEIEKFKDFFATINSIFENYEENETRTFSICLERFNWAQVETLRIDRRLMYAVMGLDPLFTFENDSGISYKLGLRSAKLFSFLGADTAEIRDNIKFAYDFRNKVVHGGNYFDDWEKTIEGFLPTILQYLRISLILFIINIEKGKDNLLRWIDEALMNDTGSEKVKKTIDRYRNRFDICFTDIVKK